MKRNHHSTKKGWNWRRRHDNNVVHQKTDEIIGDDDGLVGFWKRWKKGAIFVEIFEIRSKMVWTWSYCFWFFFFWNTWRGTWGRDRPEKKKKMAFCGDFLRCAHLQEYILLILRCFVQKRGNERFPVHWISLNFCFPSHRNSVSGMSRGVPFKKYLYMLTKLGTNLHFLLLGP